MDLSTYQQEAAKTDRNPLGAASDVTKAFIIPLLGLAGETGQLLTEYKKHLRDGESYKLFKERVSEELGDLLWYISNVATKFDLDLADIASRNLAKTQERWGEESLPASFDADFPKGQRLPRQFVVEITERIEGGQLKVSCTVDGLQLGATLTDNAYDLDGYRFHDVFHFAYAAVLGWSPVVRVLLKRKRKSNMQTDEVEDGGRALVIEEGIAALVFSHAQGHGLYVNVQDLDYNLLRTIQNMTSHLEVSKRTVGDWQRAILSGFSVWRKVVQNRGGRVAVDLDRREISYLAR